MGVRHPRCHPPPAEELPGGAGRPGQGHRTRSRLRVVHRGPRRDVPADGRDGPRPGRSRPSPGTQPPQRLGAHVPGRRVSGLPAGRVGAQGLPRGRQRESRRRLGARSGRADLPPHGQGPHASRRRGCLRARQRTHSLRAARHRLHRLAGHGGVRRAVADGAAASGDMGTHRRQRAAGSGRPSRLTAGRRAGIAAVMAAGVLLGGGSWHSAVAAAPACGCDSQDADEDDPTPSHGSNNGLLIIDNSNADSWPASCCAPGPAASSAGTSAASAGSTGCPSCWWCTPPSARAWPRASGTR
ncbi:hypothetical protein SCOCK_10313 [Actinacidiphila cocklensis]|uniref:Uncharacterized protein n=1 Tax=Actinacidiphila cocklensis TaxID=887465 RepID=A0A9W4DIH8_9ACTN|nr:hypothetical protein SCOCK_10313 [Actinacidiphila cocklensis]